MSASKAFPTKKDKILGIVCILLLPLLLQEHTETTIRKERVEEGRSSSDCVPEVRVEAGRVGGQLSDCVPELGRPKLSKEVFLGV